MRPALLPLYFEPGRDEGFDRQLGTLRDLLGGEADFLPAVALGSLLPEADAVIFPQLLGEGYRHLKDFKELQLPILVVTSEFGTMSMWDWELIDYLRSERVVTLAPFSLEQTRKIISALRVRRELRETKFLVYQDNPGQGQQAPIFKRFYWWESECTQRMVAKFGITIEKRSFKELGARARSISDNQAAETHRKWNVPTDGLSGVGLNNATKLYLAVRQDLQADPNIRAVGMNCLNESHFANTTPCLAWNRLYMEDAMIWGCEGDTVSMLTKFILHRALDAPVLMTNLYPFLMGNAALKHERIPDFPTAIKGDPRDYILVAHCGYMGVIPQPFATEWKLKKKVLAIVDDDSNAIDARLPEGKITLAKMHSTFDRMTVAEGELEGYAQYPGSDCLNGGIVHVSNGARLLGKLASHHYILMTGAQLEGIQTIAPIFELSAESL
jgi:hypothetical protein